MARFTSNHDQLYFDTLCRTKKGESVLSLIHATYQAKQSGVADVKAEIANRLMHAYNLFKGSEGSYTGNVKQFESQYTIGHELCIWKNSALDLTDLALKVAKNEITIREYFDIVFLNYIQPVNNNIVHLLYHLLEYMKKMGIKTITKEQMGKVYMEVGHATSPGEVNGAYNMLIATDYFMPDTSKKELIYHADCSIEELMDRCDTTYIVKGYEAAKEELSEEKNYIAYLLNDHRIISVDDSYELLSEEELAKELNSLNKKYGTMGIHLFGVKRGRLIREKKYSVKEIVTSSGLQDSYVQEVNKGIRLSAVVMEKPVINEELLDQEEKTDDRIIVNKDDFIEGGYNAIYYGTPGCGKSWKVENEILENVPEKYKFRTTFYLDYTHTDFVGQLLPVVEKQEDGSDKVTYSFIPGPFTLALTTAYKNPKEKVYLIIEEINRGNAASIMGDIFQLLDREKVNNKKKNKVGQSVYSINKVDLNNYLLNDEHIVLPDGKIFIPSNLYIIATMNTNDQGVFTLDTAFKRRWNMEKLPNKFDDDHPYADRYIPGTNITWKVFVEKINKKIVNDDSIGINAEDKQIGQYFMDEMVLDVEPDKSNEKLKRDFAYKMLEYIWSSVAKNGSRGNWFKGDPKTLDKVVDTFVNNGVDVFKEGIFDNDDETDI